MSDPFARLGRISGRDATALKGILQRHVPTACMACGGELIAGGQLTAVWNDSGMYCVGLCPRCSVQMGVTTSATAATVRGSDAKLEIALDRFAEKLGIDPVLSREDSEGP